MSAVPITLLYAGILGLLAVLLANYVLYVRLRARVLPAWRGNAAERVQANFVENVPLALILLYLLEVSIQHLAVQKDFLIHVFGTTLVVFRILHAWGLARNEGANYPRLIGAQGTFLVMGIMGATALVISVNSWVGS